MSAQREKIPVAVLGATGAVGQTFVRLLDGHPWLTLVEVAASERTAGRRYADGVRWLGGGVPPFAADLPVLACDPAEVTARLVFSALDASVAREVEGAFAAAGKLVLSNARSYRMDPDVPLLIPEVNADHIALLERQRALRGWEGGIVTNANCAAIVIVMALAPLHAAFGVRKVFVTTMQAISGAGYPGVPSLDILGNVIPYIANEEEKIESETAKMLGSLDGDTVRPAPLVVSAQANRVPVEHGHTACLSVGLERKATPEEALRVLREWQGCVHDLALPSSPRPPLVVSDAPDRPQPRHDVHAGNGMAVVVGRVRKDPILDLRLVATGHNTIRGAAGASILNAEYLVARGLVRG
jgi:aspartate-semialdehyde dehydrogenase